MAKKQINMDIEKATSHMQGVLANLGVDVYSEDLKQTPTRFVKFLADSIKAEPFNFTTFDAKGQHDMILQGGIPFMSLCEHHCLPFFGTAVIAYIPQGRLAGLSKLARAVQYCAKGLQTQERITKSIADLLEQNLAPYGVGVTLRAMHTCMTLRGVKAHDTWTTTTCVRGVFYSSALTRGEFLAAAREEWK